MLRRRAAHLRLCHRTTAARLADEFRNSKLQLRRYSFRGKDNWSRLHHDLAQNRPASQSGERVRCLIQRRNAINHGTQTSRFSPGQCVHKVLSISSVAAHQALLFYKKWPQVQSNFPTSGRPAGHDRSTTRQTIEALLDDLATDMFDY